MLYIYPSYKIILHTSAFGPDDKTWEGEEISLDGNFSALF